jgi:acid phosphatase (class A)
MNRILPLAFGSALLAFSHQAGAQGDKTYLATTELDTTQFMAPPPSKEITRKELDQVLALQEKRTKEQAERSVADLEQSVFRFADVIGAEFTAEKFPRSAEIFQKVYKTESDFNKQGKEKWNRNRPQVVDARIQPVAKFANSGSYPSGHAAFAYLTAIVLADIVPEKREAIFARAAEFGDNRVIGGVHYPSDIESGKQMAAMIAVLMYKNPAFRKDLEEARAEIRAGLNLGQ